MDKRRFEQKRERLMRGLVEASPDVDRQGIAWERQSRCGLHIRHEAEQMVRRAGL